MVRLKGSALASPLVNTVFSFNSTMVRLKVGLNDGMIDKCSSFNSTMVRLKGRLSEMNPSMQTSSFNSTMVRLKVDLPRDFLEVVPVFQFHNGSIKR